MRREFVDAVVNAVSDLLPNMEVTSKVITKNNGVTLNGIIIKKANDVIAPTIYIEHYIDDNNRDNDNVFNINRIAKAIVDTYNHNTDIPNDVSNLINLMQDFDNVKHLLRIRLVNKANNTKMFEDVPYLPFLDMAIIAIIEVSNDKNGSATIKITKTMLDAWNVVLSDIFDIAKENTFNSPYQLRSMTEVMCEMMGCDMADQIYGDDPLRMHVLSNQPNFNGATEICNAKTMKEIADKLQSDLIVLPSSIHEVIIIPKNDDVSIEQLTQMVQEINGDIVADDEVLSDHAYIYSRENGWED